MLLLDCSSRDNRKHQIQSRFNIKVKKQVNKDVIPQNFQSYTTEWDALLLEIEIRKQEWKCLCQPKKKGKGKLDVL